MAEHKYYRDLVHDQIQYPKKGGIKGLGIVFLSHFIETPVLGWLLRHSFAVTCCALARFRYQGRYRRLYRLLNHSFSQTKLRRTPHYWWYLMRFAVALTQERQIHWFDRDIAVEDNLMLLGSLGPRPLKGYDVAYSFVGYALWLFERGNVASAISMVQLAEEADETWGYPEYLHGWFGLFTTGVNSVEYFAKAVQIDWSFLQKMKHDKACSEHPDMLHEVQKRIVISK